MHLSRVDLPEPLWPKMPTVSPSCTWKAMSESAEKSSLWPVRGCSRRSFSDWWRS